LLILTLVGAAAGVCQAAPARNVRPHSLFSDHMVLQRGVAVPVWGSADAGGTVTVSVAGQTASTVADAKGGWIAKLEPLKAGGPHELTIAGAQSITLKNVLVGDVWICSGQSNMEQGIAACSNPKEETAKANYPRIRLFMVPHHIAGEPQTTVNASWQTCSPATVAAGGWGGFSGAAYYFGRHLHKELDVPIGLIQTCWGGTIAEAWTSAEALKTLPDFKPAVEQFEQLVADLKKGQDSYKQRVADWWRTNDPGSAKGWADPAFDASAWKPMALPQHWEKVAELGSFDGLVWFRRQVDVPAAWAGKDLLLELGPIDDRDTTFGRNLVAVRVLDTGGGGGGYGQPGPLRLSRPGGAGKPVALAGPWSYQIAAPMGKLPPLPVKAVGGSPNVVTVLYNGMIAPLVPCAIKGAIWYQGESNAGRAMQYRTLLPTMINDWRTRFGVGDFPFFIVQLANFMAVQTTPVQSGWAELREAQLLTAQKDPNVGLAVITDIGDARDIHPKNKQDVGKRLALSALAVAYGRKLVHSGPQLRAMKVEGGTARLAFDHVGGGLVARGGAKLKGFAVAGDDKQFHWADAVIEGESIVVSSPNVARPAAVRYNWANNPIGNLFSKDGLPAGPFRTDVTPTK
jgi:sialate O-acetylesterase